MNNEIILIGIFQEIIELLEDNKISINGLVDNIITHHDKYPVIGTDDEFLSMKSKYTASKLIITPDVPNLREKLYEKYNSNNYKFHTLISKDAKISKSSFIGNGSVIQYGVNVSSSSVVGKFNKLNTNSNIMHDVELSDFVTIAPNAVLLGNVKIGYKCYIGANSTILPNISICDNVIVGAGSVVTKDIKEAGKYAGAPARKI